MLFCHDPKAQSALWHSWNSYFTYYTTEHRDTRCTLIHDFLKPESARTSQEMTNAHNCRWGSVCRALYHIKINLVIGAICPRAYFYCPILSCKTDRSICFKNNDKSPWLNWTHPPAAADRTYSTCSEDVYKLSWAGFSTLKPSCHLSWKHMVLIAVSSGKWYKGEDVSLTSALTT